MAFPSGICICICISALILSQQSINLSINQPTIHSHTYTHPPFLGSPKPRIPNPKPRSPESPAFGLSQDPQECTGTGIEANLSPTKYVCMYDVRACKSLLVDLSDGSFWVAYLRAPHVGFIGVLLLMYLPPYLPIHPPTPSSHVRNRSNLSPAPTALTTLTARMCVV
jgi:hypothetical protein